MKFLILVATIVSLTLTAHAQSKHQRENTQSIIEGNERKPTGETVTTDSTGTRTGIGPATADCLDDTGLSDTSCDEQDSHVLPDPDAAPEEPGGPLFAIPLVCALSPEADVSGFFQLVCFFTAPAEAPASPSPSATSLLNIV